MAVAIVPAAGNSSRFGDNKLFQTIADKPLLYFSLRQLHDHPSIEKILIALNKKEFIHGISIIESFGLSKTLEFIEGGAERQDSIFNCLKKIDKRTTDIVIVHDAARPLISHRLLNAGLGILQTQQVEGAIPVLPVSDTLKKVTGESLVNKTISRNDIYIVQTPQFFRYDVLFDCHTRAKRDNILGMDDAFLLEYYGYKVACFTGDNKNIKITYKEDMELATFYLKGLEI